MNTNKMKLAVLLIVFSILVPHASQAYFTTAQSATRITEDTILYTVTYKFGFAKRELYMPIVATRGLVEDHATPHTGFNLVTDSDEVVTTGTANGIVLSSDEDVEIRDNQYYVPAGETAAFTLVTLLTIPADQQGDEDLSVLVTNLPFTMVKEGTPIPAHLNPSELQYYRTPAVGFDE